MLNTIRFSQETGRLRSATAGGTSVSFFFGRMYYKRLVLFTAVVLVCGVGAARAGIIGSQAFADIGQPTTNNGAFPGDINTSTIFSMGNLLSTGSQQGVFVGMSNQFIGPATFNTTVPTSFSFGNSVFGTFDSTSITETVNQASPSGVVDFTVLGEYYPGSYVGGSGPAPATIHMSWNQTPAGTGEISNSFTIAVVPEPSSTIMAMTALAAWGLVAFRRRLLRFREPIGQTQARLASGASRQSRVTVQ